MGSPDFDECWKLAFGLSIAEIEGANSATVASVYDTLRKNSGDHKKQVKALIICLGLTGWHWRPYSIPCRTEADYRKMAQALADRVESLAHGLYRKEQLMEVAETRPYWEFKAGDDARTPEPCRKIDGTVKHFRDPFWQEHLPPCTYVFCKCQVFSLSERDLARRGSRA